MHNFKKICLRWDATPGILQKSFTVLATVVGQDRVRPRARPRLPRHQAGELSARLERLQGVKHHSPDRLWSRDLLQRPLHKQARAIQRFENDDGHSEVHTIGPPKLTRFVNEFSLCLLI